MADWQQCIYCGWRAYEPGWGCHQCGLYVPGRDDLTPSADVPACRDEDPAHAAALAACYPDPEDDDDRGPLWTADMGDDAWW